MTNGMERRVAERSKQFYPGYICGRARMSYGQSWNKRPQGKLALGPTLDQEVKWNTWTYSSIYLSTHDMDIFSWGKTPPDFPRCRGEAFSTNWVTIRLSLCVPQGRKWTLNGPDKSHPSHIKTGAKFSVRTPGTSHSTDTHLQFSQKKRDQGSSCLASVNFHIMEPNLFASRLRISPPSKYESMKAAHVRWNEGRGSG